MPDGLDGNPNPVASGVKIGDLPRGSPMPSHRLARYRDVDSEAVAAVPAPVRDDSPGVVFVTGVPGAGKTTVARALARSFARGAHVEEDWVWWWLTMSGAAGRSDEEAFKRERGQVFLRHVGSLVDNFATEGFVPIVDGAIMRRSWLGDRLAQIQTRPALLVVLAPSEETSRSRDATRSGVTFYEEYPDFVNSLATEFGGLGLWVDSAGLGLEETVALILGNLEFAVFDGD